MLNELPEAVSAVLRQLGKKGELRAVLVAPDKIPPTLAARCATQVYKISLIAPPRSMQYKTSKVPRHDYYYSLDGQEPGLYDVIEAMNTTMFELDQDELTARRNAIRDSWSDEERERRAKLYGAVLDKLAK